MERWLNEVEVAEYTGLTLATLRNWRSRKTVLPFYKLGAKSVRYKKQDIDDILERGKHLPDVFDWDAIEPTE